MKASHERRLGLLFISPFLIGSAVFTIYRRCASFYYSFCEYDILNAPRFVGLDNYREMCRDGRYWKALWNTHSGHQDQRAEKVTKANRARFRRRNHRLACRARLP